MRRANMTMNEFAEIVKDNIAEYLPENIGGVEITDVPKNNGIIFKGITLADKTNPVPAVYLERDYEAYVNYEAGIDKVLKDVARRLTSSPVSAVELDALKNYDPGKTICRLISAKLNEGYVSDRPHRKAAEDLYLIYGIKLDVAGQNAAVWLENKHMEALGVNEETLYKDAMKNAEQASDITSMAEMFPFIDASDAGMPPMYIVSNESRLNGAVSILLPSVHEKLREIIGEDYMIIPSSIHECIAIPALDTNDVTSMIGMVNSEQLLPEEVLSDHPYVFDQNGLIAA